MRDHRHGSTYILLVAFIVVVWPLTAMAQEEATVSGTLIANGETIELPYVYVYAEDKGFYDESDPTWKVIFAAEPIGPRDLDSFFFDFPFVKVGVTLSAEFSDGGEAEIQALSQDIQFSAEGSSVSGGDYPEVELESFTPERFAGRIYQTEPHTIFDDTYEYDFSFSTPLSDPHAPIGPPLPEGGGEPGGAYVAWIQALHSGDLEQLRPLVTPEMAEMLEAPEAAEDLEFMRAMAPTEVSVLSGSSDGATAILMVEGLMDGQPVKGEITMSLQGEIWLSVAEAWE